MKTKRAIGIDCGKGINAGQNKLLPFLKGGGFDDRRRRRDWKRKPWQGKQMG